MLHQQQELKKVAIITSQHIFSRISIRQMIYEFSHDIITFNMQYFTGEKAVMQWLCKWCINVN